MINIMEAGEAPLLPHEAFVQWYKTQTVFKQLMDEPDPGVKEKMIEAIALTAFMTGVTWSEAVPAEHLKMIRQMLIDIGMEQMEDSNTSTTAE